jgi:trans-aconitate methyltransferase
MYAEQRDWPGYFKAVEGKPPRDTLLQALEVFEPNPEAIRFAVDLGCGEGRDTAELLRRGWRVLAIDAHPMALDLLQRRSDLPPQASARLATRLQPFERVDIPECDLLNASFSLPFCPPEHFDALWAKIRAALRPGAVLAGQLFGERDAWADLPDRSHHTRAQVESLLAGLKPLRLEEEERDGEDCHGAKKHWHVFHIVAQGSFGRGRDTLHTRNCA